jgi:2-oxoglutarate dehydrogenase E2 component (dihydrolipoamide succinyltransferase)
MHDGRDSVSFLVKMKELIENPVHLMFGGSDPEKLLLEL